MRALLVALALLGAAPARAEAPGESPRPEARAVMAVGRPEPRAALGRAAMPVARPAPRPGGEPAVPLAPPSLRLPGLDAVDRPGRDVLPFVGRRAPLLFAEQPPPPLPGLGQEVRVEEAMGPPPVVAVAVGAWAGLEPRPRPARGAGVALGPALEPAPGRPKAQPLPLGAAMPALPVEPEAPPAYAPLDASAFVPGEGVTALAVTLAVLPLPRPEGVTARAEAARAEARRGQVCGNPLIQGSAEASFGSASGCGIADPVRVRSVDGVSLSAPALMDCTTAEALLTWVQRGVRPALGGRGGGLARLDVMGDYACRGRNNRAGERLNEHGRGRAVDVGGLTLADGSQVVVLRDWPGGGLREMHDAACGPFSTVLGPEANSFHANHLHLDTARGRGPYCR